MSKNKKNILVFADWYLPGYRAGGPIKSVAATVSNLKGVFNFYIITTDKDFGAKQPYKSIESDRWIELDEDVHVFYASEAFLSLSNIKKLLADINYDVVYLNSLFSPLFAIYPLWLKKRNVIKKPVLLAPRGMLGENSLNIKSTKKNVFLAASKWMKLHKKINWHATSVQEEQEILNVFGTDANITTVSNLQYKSKNEELVPADKQVDALKLLFVSRISQIKNLLFALDILLKANVTGKKLEMDIIGPIEEPSYWEVCQVKIQELKQKNIIVKYLGEMASDKIANAMIPYHFLFLPTRNENYGHVIVEALMNGKPVIISDQTPWRNLESKNAGWDIPLNNAGKFVSVIERCCVMNNDQYTVWSKSAATYIHDTLKLDEAIKNTNEMFNKVIQHG